MEFQDPSWHVDETFAALTSAGAAWCSTESPEDETAPDIRRTGPFLYLRLRRHDYTPAEVTAWAARLEPFLHSGMDAFVFFRHDPVGRGPELAIELATALEPAQRPGRNEPARPHPSPGPIALGRPEDDHDLEALRDVVEAVRHARGHEDDGPRADVANLVTDGSRGHGHGS